MKRDPSLYIALCNDRQQAVLESQRGRAAMWMGGRWLVAIDKHEVCLSPTDETTSPASRECEAILAKLPFVAFTEYDDMPHQTPQYMAVCDSRQRDILNNESGRAVIWRGSRWCIELTRNEVYLSPADESIPDASKKCETVLHELPFVKLAK